MPWKLCRHFVSMIAVPVGVVYVSPALAAPETPAGPEPRKGPSWAVGLDGYAGITTLFGETDFSHGFVGGAVHGRFGAFQVTGFAERTDLVVDQWMTFGGLIGLFLPVRNWVDVDVSAGLASRTYSNPDPRYGPGGYDLATRTIVYRLGLSDRTSGELFGLRVGAQIVGSVDLGRPDAMWSYVVGEGTDAEQRLQGVTRVGGVSVGLVLRAGFELGRE